MRGVIRLHHVAPDAVGRARGLCVDKSWFSVGRSKRPFLPGPEYRPLAWGMCGFMGTFVSGALVAIADKLGLQWLLDIGFVLVLLSVTIASGGIAVFCYQQTVRGGWRASVKRRQESERRAPAPWE